MKLWANELERGCAWDQTTFFLCARTITPIAPITGKTANTAAGRLADGEYHDTEAAL